MILRLAPETPLPHIIFAISFPTLPIDLPFPAAWAHQVKELMKLSLDSPPNPHALDRSVWATTLLDQVNFDLVANSITCIYVDGVHIEFTISPACRQMLMHILGDVTDSASEAERESLEESMPAPVIYAPPSTAFSTPSHSRRASLSAFPVMPPPPLSAPPAPPSWSPHTGTDSQPPSSKSHTSNHRRSRSLLSTLLSALIPSSSVTVPPRAQLPMKKLPASRHLRRRARSTLVDCFRAHVLPEVNSHLGTAGRWGVHGYAVWACTSMLGRVEAMIQYELNQGGRGNGGSAARSKRDSAMILDYHESPFDDPEHRDATSGELVREYGEVKVLKQHADGLRGCAHKLLMREHMIQEEQQEGLMMLEIRARRRAWSTKSRGGGGQRWMGLGTPLRPSRLAFSWTPDSIEYDPADTEASFELHERQRQPPRYTVRLPIEEIEQWSERIIVDENGYHMQPSTFASPSSPPMHPADKSGSSTSTLDFDALDETIICESPDAADLDSEDEDEDEELGNEGGGETILPRELELPPGLHGPANGRRGRASYYLPRPPAEVVNTANGTNSPYRYRPGPTNMVYEDNPSFPSLSPPSKPGLSLKFPHSRECEGDRTALSLDSPTQAIPQDAVDHESFGNGDFIVGIVGVPQDVGLGVICPLTPMPPTSSVPFFADDDDVEEQDIEVDANMVIDADTDGEREPSLSPSPSSDSASVNTVSTGSDELVKVAMAHSQVRTPGSRDGEEVVDTTDDSDICEKPLRPPRNPSRLAKGEMGATETSEDVIEGAFAY